MADRPTQPRIAPLAPEEHDEEVDTLLAAAGAPPGFASNIFTTLVRNRGLFRKWLPFGGKLLNGKLPAREREIAILRVGWLCQSEYEWGQHVIIGRMAGLTDEEIERIKVGAGAEGWSTLEAMILRAADELHEDSCIGDATWKQLADTFNDAQMIELVMVIGHYHLVSFALNSLGVQREDGVPGFSSTS